MAISCVLLISWVVRLDKGGDKTLRDVACTLHTVKSHRVLNRKGQITGPSCREKLATAIWISSMCMRQSWLHVFSRLKDIAINANFCWRLGNFLCNYTISTPMIYERYDFCTTENSTHSDLLTKRLLQNSNPGSPILRNYDNPLSHKRSRPNQRRRGNTEH